MRRETERGEFLTYSQHISQPRHQQKQHNGERKKHWKCSHEFWISSHEMLKCFGLNGKVKRIAWWTFFSVVMCAGVEKVLWLVSVPGEGAGKANKASSLKSTHVCGMNGSQSVELIGRFRWDWKLCNMPDQLSFYQVWRAVYGKFISKLCS